MVLFKYALWENGYHMKNHLPKSFCLGSVRSKRAYPLNLLAPISELPFWEEDNKKERRGLLLYKISTHWPLGVLNKIFGKVIFKFIYVNGGWGIFYEIASRWIPLDLTDDTLVQVITWCRQASSHCLSNCWPRFMSPYGVTRPQWVRLNLVQYGSFITTISVVLWARYLETIWQLRNTLWANEISWDLRFMWDSEACLSFQEPPDLRKWWRDNSKLRNHLNRGHIFSFN